MPPLTIKTKLQTTLEYPYALLGIVCECREYRMAWLVNKLLDIALEKQPDGVISFKRGEPMYFIQYLFENDFEQIRLIKNKAVEPLHKALFLIPEMKQMDYLLLLHSTLEEFPDSTYLNALKASPQIRLVQAIEIESLPSKENLLI
jgi:hypothetical protein